MIKELTSTIKREIRLACRYPQEIANPIIFFVIVISLFPLAFTPESKILVTLAPGLIWVAALLATLLSLDRLFRSDYEDGSLEQTLLNPSGLSIFVIAKVFSHWLLTGWPLILISPLLGIMLGLSFNSIMALFLSLLIGTPILSLLGAIGASLTLGLRSSAVLLTLLILPLYIPVLIFGSSCVITAAAIMPYHGQLLLLAAMLVLAVTLSPFAIVAGLRLCGQY